MLDLGSPHPVRGGRTQKVSERDTTHLNISWAAHSFTRAISMASCYGELRCLESASGRRIWQTLEATTVRGKPQERWANVFVIKTDLPIVTFFNESGEPIDCREPRGYRTG